MNINANLPFVMDIVNDPINAGKVVNFLPGPIDLHPDVRQAFAAVPISHRSERFMQDVADVKSTLCRLLNVKHVELFLGSGTLANDVVGTQLSLLPSRGVILSNGEFGERLLNHAQRLGLHYDVLRVEWGKAFDYEQLARHLAQHPQLGWLWCVHHETSTGVLNHLPRLKAICKTHDLLLCLDCISSTGLTQVNLQDVYLASGVSGKGFASFAGLAMVFYNHRIEPSSHNVPRYLDLGYYAQCQGVPFTTSSNLMYALQTSLNRLQPEVRLTRIRYLSRWIRNELRRRGFSILAADEDAFPAVMTIVLPQHVDSVWAGDCLEECGYLVSYKSSYLVARNWIQLCLMSEYLDEMIVPLFDLLDRLSDY